MSRRKQLNPKPLNKGDCSDTAEDMTVDNRDPKDFNMKNDAIDVVERHSNCTPPSTSLTWDTDVEMADKSVDSINTKNMDTFPDESSDEKSLVYREIKEELSRSSPHSSEHRESGSMERNASVSPKYDSDIMTDESKEITQKTPPTSSDIRNSPLSSCNLPKLRLNTLLASDPALKPDAKDLKLLQEEAQTQHRKGQFTHTTDKLNTAMENTINNLPVEPVIKAGPSGVEVPPPPPPRMKVFMCIPCGIGFSSPSTLEAHQAYYCSHRHKETEENSTPSCSTTEKTMTSPSIATNSFTNVQSSEPTVKAHKTGKQYACTQCSYSADKKVSLNRHMRIHQSSPTPTPNVSTANNVVCSQLDENSSQQIDRYCSDCDIRFNNVKTYRAHKQHYCNSRRSEGPLTPKLEVSSSCHSSKSVNSVTSGIISPQNRTKTPTPAMMAAVAASPFLLLPTNPVLIIPYSVIRSASVIGGPSAFSSPGVINPDTTCFALENGNLKPLATVVNINTTLNNATNQSLASNSHQLVDSTLHQTTTSNSNESSVNEKNIKYNTDDSRESTPKSKERTFRESTPLDLSLRRSPITTLLQRQRIHSDGVEREAVPDMGKDHTAHDESGCVTPEQIVCAPSLPNSPTMTPSPCRKTTSPRSSGACSNSSISPPSTTAMSVNLISNSTHLLENLQFRSMMPTDILNPILAKQNLELALKLSVAAAAVSSSSGAMQSHSSNPAELAAAAVAAATGRAQLLGLPVLPPVGNASGGNSIASGNQPQIFVKQGVSKCKECNIVFCKYENYLAHKQHYCSSRNQDVGDAESKSSPTLALASTAPATENTPVAYQQLICAACGIKYTSLDNLRAHQNYYCPKGVGAAASASAPAATGQLPLTKETKCTKCNTVHELTLSCPMSSVLQQQQQQQQQKHQQQQQQHTALFLSSGGNMSTGSGSNTQNLYKCPLCDVMSLTATESRKHMETHGTVKAFRCTICGYKGNTLRGMRTHIRMHVDKKTNDFNEEHYMTCILEDENIEIPTVDQLAKQQQQQQQQHQKHLHQTSAVSAAVPTADFQQQQQQQQQSQQVFNCDICSYTSTYKGNVLRHMKLLHPHALTNSPSLSPEVAAPDTNDSPSLANSLNGDNSLHSFNIKTEPLDNAAPNPATSGVILNARDNNNSFISSTTHLATNNDMATMMTNIKTEPMELAVESSTPVRGPPPSTLNNTLDECVNQKYCQSCDISFNYLKTYLAHKQFYCMNKIKRSEGSDSPSPNPDNLIMSMPSPNNLPMQKNKENMQQEAAI